MTQNSQEDWMTVTSSKVKPYNQRKNYNNFVNHNFSNNHYPQGGLGVPKKPMIGTGIPAEDLKNEYLFKECKEYRECREYKENYTFSHKKYNKPIGHFWNGFDTSGSQKWFIEFDNGYIISNKNADYPRLIKQFFPDIIMC